MTIDQLEKFKLLASQSEVHVFDFDNTIWDAESRLADWFPEFEPLNQTSYKFSELKYLESFADDDFYRGDFLNKEVVDYIEYLQSIEKSVIFISSSPNESVHEAKCEIIRGIGKGSPYLVQIPHGMDEFMLRHPNYVNAVFYDDAPHRFEVISSLGYRYVPVNHPYNTDYHRPLHLSPNYMLEVDGHE